LATSQFERIKLGKKPLDALPHMIALASQGTHLCLELLNQRTPLVELGLDPGYVLFRRNPGLPLALYQFNRAHDTLFKSRKIVFAESQGTHSDGLLGRSLLRRKTFCHFGLPQ
jgi:hypothetical protein